MTLHPSSMSNPLSADANRGARRYLALWFPFLPTDRLSLDRRVPEALRARGEAPLVLIEKIRGAIRILSLDAAATELGLSVGMSLADARARFPTLLAWPADAAEDRRFLQQLAAETERFTPLAALDEPHGLILDTTGGAHLFGGEEAMRRCVASFFARRPLTVRSSLAGTPELARALARFSRLGVVAPGAEESVARRLPIAALEAAADIALALRRAGLRTLGDLADRPSAALTARFGETVSRRLQRILGREDARITPLRSPPALSVERRFLEPMKERAGLETALIALAHDITAQLEDRGEGGRVFEAWFFRGDGEVRRLSIETGRPCRAPETLLRLLREKLESLADPLDPGFGYDSVRLAAPVTEKFRPLQPDLDGHAAEAMEIAALIDRLSVRLGAARVLRFAPRDTYQPERAAVSLSAGAEVKDSSAVWEKREEGEPPLRPLQLFAPPQPIEVLAEVPDGPPLKFRWRRVLHEVMQAEGPERIAPEWWRSGAGEPARDYYRIEDVEGRRFWVFRRGFYEAGPERPRWFLHGLFA